jgi:hypothetical protein
MVYQDKVAIYFNGHQITSATKHLMAQDLFDFIVQNHTRLEMSQKHRVMLL